MKDPISHGDDRLYAALARRMHAEEGRGLIAVVNEVAHDVRLSLVEEHLEGCLKNLIETMIQEYDPEKQYVLVVHKRGSLHYIGTRDL